MKTIKFTIVAILLLNIGLFVACSDDDNISPITLKDYEEVEPNINLVYPAETGEYHFRIQGGDGNYSVTTNNPEIISPEIIQLSEFSASDINLKMKVLGIGNAKITITDKSQNSLILNVTADYLTQKFIVKKHEITIIGGDLTENEKKAISEKHLADIPAKVNGGYKFIYTDRTNNRGITIIYPNMFGSEGIETSFEIKEVKNENYPEATTVSGYEVLFNNEKRIFVLDIYYPSTKDIGPVVYALKENITQNVQIEYLKAELVYTSQVVVRSTH